VGLCGCHGVTALQGGVVGCRIAAAAQGHQKNVAMSAEMIIFAGKIITIQ